MSDYFHVGVGCSMFIATMGLCSSILVLLCPDNSVHPVFLACLSGFASIVASVYSVDIAADVKKKSLMIALLCSTVFCLESVTCCALASVSFYKCVKPVNKLTAGIIMNSSGGCIIEAVHLLYCSMACLVCSILICGFSCIRERLTNRQEFNRSAHLKV